MKHIALVILLITTSLSLGGCFVRKGQGAYLYAWMINATDEASPPLEGLLGSPRVNSSEEEDDQA